MLEKNEQVEIKGPTISTDQGKRSCDWCSQKALFFFECVKRKLYKGHYSLVPNGIKWYSCANHLDQLHDAKGHSEVKQIGIEDK